MGIEVERLDSTADIDWDSRVAESPMASVFHRAGVLDVLANHSGSTLHPLVGYKGQEIVGLFPLFEIRKGPVSTVFSPPPRLGIPNLGPVLTNYEKLKRKKRDRRNKRFVEGCLDWLDSRIGPKYVHIEATSEYQDLRPFQWASYDVTPRYTYYVHLEDDPQQVIARFKSNLRSDIRRHSDAEYEVFEGGEDAIDFTIAQVRERFEQQGKKYAVTADYVTDLYYTLPDGFLRPYIGAVNDKWQGGILVPGFDDRMLFWQGGSKPDVALPINDLIHWQIIRDGIARGFETYDLTGANTHRIAEYKAKFNPDLSTYFEVEHGTRTMNAVSEVYRKLR